MYKYNFLAIIILCSINISAQDHFEKVDKQYSFELGYRNVFSNSFFDNQTHGETFLFDYAWKLSGYHKKPAAYISVPLGYTNLFVSDSSNTKIGILSYGWTVNHELNKDKKVIYFLGYALLLNQLRISGTNGTLFGHQTRFDFGFNLNTSKRLIPFFKVEYSFTRYPSLGNKKSDQMHAFEAKIGLRFFARSSKK